MARHVIGGSGAPLTTPEAIGLMYVDGDDVYYSVGTVSSADWKKSTSLASDGSVLEDTPRITLSADITITLGSSLPYIEYISDAGFGLFHTITLQTTDNTKYQEMFLLAKDRIKVVIAGSGAITTGLTGSPDIEWVKANASPPVIVSEVSVTNGKTAMFQIVKRPATLSSNSIVTIRGTLGVA